MAPNNAELSLIAPVVKAPFVCRPADQSDVKALASVFFDSFNAPFFKYAMPDTPRTREWWEKAWLMGIKDDPTARTFIVFDSSTKDEVRHEGKPVAFCRWIVPQSDGNLDRLWPDLLEDEWDMGVMGSFFHGMDENRAKLMGKRPHWMLEMLGTHEDYQRHGLGSALVKWGCDLADQDGLEVYLDASERGAPVYQKHFAFESRMQINIPDRPAYGSFVYLSHVRPHQSV
ncbi:hypothetical protein AAFC00_001935 [Neodothiora populina]